MVIKMRQSPNLSLLPLSLLVATCGWKVGSASAQTVDLLPSVPVSTSDWADSTREPLCSIVDCSSFLATNRQPSTDNQPHVFSSPVDGRDTKEEDTEIEKQGDAENFSAITSPSPVVEQGQAKPWPMEMAQNPNPGRQVPTFPIPLPQPLPSPDSPSVPSNIQEPPSQTPQEAPPLNPLPPPEQLLQPQSVPDSPEPIPGKVPDRITVTEFRFEGNTAISDAELAEATKEFIGKPISFAELFQARSAVTQLYIERGYITSGALIPPQTLEDGIVTIQVVEGTLEEINVSGTRRLNSDYVRSRIALATYKPLNRERLLQSLQLLQLNPLIQNISAELAAGTQPGSSVLEVTVSEADTLSGLISIDNNRAPSVGTVNRRVQITEANLSGAGDTISLGYSNTDGSNGIDFSYTLPINARNGTLRFSYGTTSSVVIEPPFNRLDINASSRYYELTLRQPLVQTPTEEFAIGLTASRQESETSVLEIPFPLSLGADDEGRTRISALRFFQEWTKRNSREVLAARSQFSVGLNTLSSTINEQAPDSRFFSWRGQAQWVRLLAPETLFLIRGDVQLADRALVPLEQIGLGGQQTIRGYRQDLLLTDNGALISAEVRVPVLRLPQWETLVQLAPFVDLGGGWNREGRPDPDPSFLASLGLGLQLQVSNYLSVRLDYGIPLVSVSSSERTWQESGFYFSVVATPF